MSVHDFVLHRAEALDSYAYGPHSCLEIDSPRRRLYANDIARILFRFSHWLSLPWACRFLDHDEVVREHFNGDVHAVEERWIECERCGEWIRWSADDPQGRGR